MQFRQCPELRTAYTAAGLDALKVLLRDTKEFADVLQHY